MFGYTRTGTSGRAHRNAPAGVQTSDPRAAARRLLRPAAGPPHGYRAGSCRPAQGRHGISRGSQPEHRRNRRRDLRDRVRQRYQRAQNPGRAVDARAENGGRGPPGRRRGARLQQYAHGDRGLQPHDPGRAFPDGPFARLRGRDSQSSRPGRRPDQSTAGLQPPPDHAAARHQPQCRDRPNRKDVAPPDRRRHPARDEPWARIPAISRPIRTTSSRRS